MKQSTDAVLVSVIIPAYNCAAYIDGAIESALQQDVPLEIIIIDDCSKDNLQSHILRYADNPQITYVRNERNMGVSASRNRGIAMAKGAYIALLDADDQWVPNKLARQIQLLEETGNVMCSTARELMTLDGTLSGYVIPVPTEYTYRDICFQNQVNCSSVVIRAEVAREFPMEHDDAHEDYIMWLKVLKKYNRGCAINEPLLRYRISSSGKSGNKLHSARLTFRTYRYMGFGFFRSLLYFLSYAYHGVKKYFWWFVK